MRAPVIHILPLTTLRRERLLPVSGRITARIDQKVSSLDIIAEAHYGQKHQLIDVARSLGVKTEAAQQMIRVKAGDTILKGETIAQVPGVFPKTLPAPTNGRVILVSGGRILMELGEETFELRAGIPGRVTRLIPDRGVEITFNGAFIQGVWGNSQIGLGVMLPMFSSPDETLTTKQIDISLRGSILLAGHCKDPSVLEAANELPLRGMILGSLVPNLVPLARRMNYPIIVINGIGFTPMDNASFKLLTTNAKREVSINAEPINWQTGIRPEIMIPMPVTQEPPAPRDLETFAPNQTIRLTRNPFYGATGTLIRLLPGLTAIPSGLRVAVAEVKLDSGELTSVPLANLEVLV